MKTHAITAAIALTALMHVTTSRDARAAEELPFSADAVVQVVDYYKNGFLTEGSGNATHIGEITVQGAVRVFGDRSTSSIRLTGPEGDSVLMESDSTYDPDLGHFIGVYIITDGTGRFEDATGYGIIEPIPLGNGQFNVLYDGVISY